MNKLEWLKQMLCKYQAMLVTDESIPHYAVIMQMLSDIQAEIARVEQALQREQSNGFSANAKLVQ